ncbi:YheC/YheD family protein [Peribacillus loiseleuriae]|uniref:Alpha-L-glutamate ligase n=1 Tax=Peribacillus loiseleuriae TaxID=1679170 RepID=A0A0K9GTS1_9BACI|nr:YheC/YheD family protein [Peribacillus loiseleuriae]KMY50026.1 alpha-L-glutamate ligase [Peribacillus loiseleuriae]
MTLIGMLHHREDPQRVRRAYAYSAVAKAEGIPFFYFTPGKVNMENRTINGKIYENGNWQEKKFPFPDVIYNASYPLTDKAEIIVDFLSEIIPFTSHSVGDKSYVNKLIKKGEMFAQYLIPSMDLIDANRFMQMVRHYPKVIMKPVSGNQGKGIIFIEKEGNDKYRVNETGDISIYTKQELVEFTSRKIQEQKYLAQQFISCQIKSGQVYDFRLHVQKNGEGKWVITSIYPRIGTVGSIAPNIGSGGYTGYLDIFLQKEFDDSWYNIKKTLEYFAINFSNHFDSLYDDVSLDELGIDVGIDENQKLWLFEVNWRPGAPIIFNCELDVARNTVQYAKYLAENSQRNVNE